MKIPGIAATTLNLGNQNLNGSGGREPRKLKKLNPSNSTGLKFHETDYLELIPSNSMELKPYSLIMPSTRA
jgi:hypothetical protein